MKLEDQCKMYTMKGYRLSIVKYSVLVHLAMTHLQARAYELVPNISQYKFNNLIIISHSVYLI